MNILHTETLKGWGGQQNKVIKELINTKKLGHKVYLLANPNADIIKKAKKHDIKVIIQEMNKKTILSSALFLKKLTKELKFDLIVSHGSTDSWIVAIVKLISGVSVIRERHNLYEIKGLLSKIQHRYLFNYIIAISEAVRDYLLEIGVKRDKILMLPSVVDINKFKNASSNFRVEFNIPQDAKVVGIFTSLRRDKGLFDFFEMSKKILKDNSDVYIVYGGKYIQKDYDFIMNFYKKNNYELSKIKWSGYTENAPNVMKSFDIYVFPSYSEGLGTVLIEALACRLPAVVYDKRPMSDLVKNKLNGYTAKYKDTDDLAKKIQNLLDHKERASMGEKSWNIVKDGFSEENMQNNIQNILSQVNEKNS